MRPPRNPPPRNPPIIRCRYCDRRHGENYLCPPAKRVLTALLERGMSFNMPSLEFPDPIPAVDLGLGLGPDDALVEQFVVQAATIPYADIIRPALVFTGRNASGGVLPKWLYVGTADDMARLAGLVNDMTELAIRAAAEGRTVP